MKSLGEKCGSLNYHMMYDTEVHPIRKTQGKYQSHLSYHESRYRDTVWIVQFTR